MANSVEIWEYPQSKEIFMIAGWRQWADAGSISSGLPQYLVRQLNAKKIGKIKSDGFYLFQIPGTHDLVRPMVKYQEGYPVSLQANENEFFFAGDEQRGYIIFLGEEPHLNVDAYVGAILDTVQELKIRRVIGLGGVFGELPYNKDRLISGVYSLKKLKREMEALAVNLSDYHGGASIGSVLSKRAGEREIEYVSFYAFVPAYEFTNSAQVGNSIRIENDYVAWLNVMRRISYMLKAEFDLSDLEEKSERLIEAVDAKVDELENSNPQLGVRDYLKRLAEDFIEQDFNPLDEVWEDELRRLFEKFDEDAEEN
jgi:proteasome assembly chaperone (PAC2) family protein